MSPELKIKVETLERVKARVTATLDQYKEGLTAEKQVEVDALLSEAKTLQTDIASARAVEERRRDMADLDRFLSEPEHKIPHGINGDDDDRKMLHARGWELKGGMACAPTSTGATFPMYEEKVLFGEIPTDDADAARYYRQTRAAFAPEYRAAYVKLMTSAARARSESMAFSMLSGAEQKALTEGNDPDGGFLVPPDVQAELLVRTAQRSVMRRLARVQTTSRDLLKWPMVQAHGTSGSIYSSGFVGGWVGETPAFSETDPAFGTFDVAVKKLRVATKLSNDLVADSASNILGFLSQNGAENMALVEDEGFIAGIGAALQPLGLLNSGIATVDVEGSTTNTISNTNAAAGSAPKLIDLVYTLPSQYTTNARWLMRRAIEGDIRKLVDGQDRYLWPPMAGSGFAATPRELLGYPVENSEFVPNDGVDANKVVVFGDFSAYVIAQRAQITSMVLRERFADTDQIGIILFERVGGACWNTDAFRIGIV